MKHFALYDPEPMWRGEAGHIALSMHRAKIIMRDEDSWLQDEVPGYVLCDRGGVSEIYFGDLIALGRGAKPRYFASIEKFNGLLPEIDNRQEVVDKIDNEFLSLCKREGLL